MRSVLNLLLVLSSLLAFSQEKKNAFLTDLLVAALQADKDTVFNNFEISLDNIDASDTDTLYVNGIAIYCEFEYMEMHKYLKAYLPDAKIEDDRVVFEHVIEFRNCTFPKGLNLLVVVESDEILLYLGWNPQKFIKIMPIKIK